MNMQRKSLLNEIASAKYLIFLIVLVCALFAAIVPSAAQTAAAPSTETSCSDLKPGVVVESLAKNSEGEKAGLREGDIILRWSRAEAKGEMQSPFDLMDVEIEQEPRGQVTLEGTRDGGGHSWTMGPDKWGITARPNLSGTMLKEYREGQDSAEASLLKQEADRLKPTSPLSNSPCEQIGYWLLYRGANILEGAPAIEMFDDAIKRAQSASASRILVSLLVAKADAYRRNRNLTKADESLNEALNQSRRSGDDSLVTASLLGQLGRSAERRGDATTAESHFKDELAIAERLAPKSLAIATALDDSGNSAEDRGDLVNASKKLTEALAIETELAPQSRQAAHTLRSLGIVEDDRGDLSKSEGYYLQALTIDNEINRGSIDVASDYTNLGILARERGDLGKADEYYQQALQIQERIEPNSVHVAHTVGNLGYVARQRGDLIRAEEYFRRDLALSQTINPRSLDVARSSCNLGTVAEDRGDLIKADVYYRQGCTLFEELAPNSGSVAVCLRDIGQVAQERGDLQTAKEYLQRSLRIMEKTVPDSLSMAGLLNAIADLAIEQHNLPQAFEYLIRAKDINEKLAPNGLGVAVTHEALGEVAKQRGDLAEEEREYRQALSTQSKVSPTGVYYAEYSAALASVLEQRNQPEQAGTFYANAIDILDYQLSTLGGSSDVRASFRGKHAAYYSEYADLLLSQHKLEEAFDVMERARARTLLETLAQARVDIHQGADPAAIQKERLLQATLTAKTNRKVDLLTGEHNQKQIDEVTKEIADVLSQYQELESQIRSSSPQYASLTQPKTLSAAEVQQKLLDEDTVLLDYVLGSERSYVFVVSSSSLDVYDLPKKAEIEVIARHTYDLLTSRNRRIDGETGEQRRSRLEKEATDYDKTANALSGIVLGPVAQQIKSKRLLVVADGALQYVPFSLLPEPANDSTPNPALLVAGHEIVNLPSASVLAVLRQQAAQRSGQPMKEVAVLADPVFDKTDPRVGGVPASKGQDQAVKRDLSMEPQDDHLTRSIEDVRGSRQAGSGLPRLVFSRREAAQIMASAHSADSLQAVDFKASRDTALGGDLSQYRIVHFATHGLLDNEHPELSGLVLSMVGPDGKPQNGFVDLEDIYNLNLPADLVVLSACETGLGKEISGEGLVGLTRGFMYAGATRVVASLWQVDDAATAELMGAFYKAMLKDGLRPAAALRQAQLELQKQKRWHDPYYWAGFTLQGEWK